MAGFWEEIAHDESRPTTERLATLFEIVDENARERPLVALGALREILALDPDHRRAQQVYDRIGGEDFVAVRSMARPETQPTNVEWPPRLSPELASLTDWWVEEAEFFIAQGLWNEAREALDEAARRSPGDPRIADWIAYIDAERAAA